MLMFKENGVSREYTTEEEWLEDIFYKSNSESSKINAMAVRKEEPDYHRESHDVLGT